MRSKRRRELACPERGGGCEQSEQAEGLHRDCSCLRQPLSQTFGLPAPRPGSLLGAVQAPTQKLSPNRKEPPEGLFSLLAYSPLFLSPAVAAARAGDKQANAGDIARGRGRAAGIAGVIVAVRPAVAGGVAHGGGAGQVLGEHIARVIAADYLAPVAALFNEGDGCADPERSYYAVLGAGPFAQVKVGGGVKPGSPAL